MAEIPLDRYLDRISYAGPLEADLPTLAALQRAHLETVPFENLDIYYGPGVPLGTDAAVDKVVERRRGGWCFELNSAFAALLEALDFEVTRTAAEVLLDDEPSPTPDHLTLIVTIEGRSWLTDVGFGDAFQQPLELDSREPQPDPARPYRLTEDGDALLLEAERGNEWSPEFRFRPEPAELDTFAAASKRLQTTPGLHWTATRFATRLQGGARVTLLHDRLKMQTASDVDEQPLTEPEWHDALERWFGITGLPTFRIDHAEN